MVARCNDKMHLRDKLEQNGDDHDRAKQHAFLLELVEAAD